jgi:hypothetical protein
MKITLVLLILTHNEHLVLLILMDDEHLIMLIPEPQ